MLKPEHYAARLREARAAAGLTREEVVDQSGVDASCYLDMEADDREFPTVSSLTEVIAVLAVMQIDPYSFFPVHSSFEGAFSFDGLAAAIGRYLIRTSTSLEEFEEAVGWELRKALQDPRLFGDFSLDGLCAVCEGIGCDWRGVLTGEIRARAPGRGPSA
ncbi:MAG: helix-turn-helix domain-containing protein [Gemmatimonadetes bacterium]|nr:helix-turn-helix domain-containing protein [Gemmatimonadota bacterium]MBK9065266.1 helix-turn-helix domain-containing protein [Gemmatimonadota bacterium]